MSIKCANGLAAHFLNAADAEKIGEEANQLNGFVRADAKRSFLRGNPAGFGVIRRGQPRPATLSGAEFLRKLR